MNAKQAKYPQLRFKGFTDPWEQRKLNNYLDVSKEKNKNNYYSKDEVLSVSGKVGIVNQIAFQGRSFAGASVAPYRVVHNGDVVYTKSPLSRNPFGIIKTNKGKTGIVSTLYAVYKPISNLTNTEFVQSYFELGLRMNKYMKPLVNIGAKHDMKVSDANALLGEVVFPSFEEQSKITKFLGQLDDLITLHQRKLAKLKELKQGYLQKLFPKNGSKFPQLRFAGFADAWEQRKFESLLNKNDGIRRGPFGSALKKEFFVPKSEYVVYEQQNAIYDNYKTRYNITKKKFDELSRFELRPNDFIMSGAGTIGRISRVPNDIKKGVFNQALIRFRINTSITDSEYFVQFIRADFMQRKLTNANPGSAITNLVPMSEVKKWIIQFPNLKEQQKIGTFFQQLDHLITLHQRKLEKLQELKKGYLQKMFC